MFHLSVLFGSFRFGPSAPAQGGKTFLKEGDAFRKDGDLAKAVEKYDLAISVDPDLIKAYQARAEVNQLPGQYSLGSTRSGKIAELDPANAEFVAAAAKAYMEIDSTSTGQGTLRPCIEGGPQEHGSLADHDPGLPGFGRSGLRHHGVGCGACVEGHHRHLLPPRSGSSRGPGLHDG